MKTTKKSSLDIVYGVLAVTESLEANTSNKLYIQDQSSRKNVDAIRALAAERRFPSLGHLKPCLMTGGLCIRFCSLILGSQLL